MIGTTPKLKIFNPFRQRKADYEVHRTYLLVQERLLPAGYLAVLNENAEIFMNVCLVWFNCTYLEMQLLLASRYNIVDVMEDPY